MTDKFIDTSLKLLNSKKNKIDEDGNIIIGENVQVILESTITSIEE